VPAIEPEAVNKTFLVTRRRGPISTLGADNPPVLLMLDTSARRLMENGSRERAPRLGLEPQHE
jgi:hypothetical protein